MIGLVVTGHLNFATGIRSALEAVTGLEGQMEFVDYVEDSSDVLERNLSRAAKAVNHGDGVLFLSDIPGGSPFQKASLVAGTIKEPADVIAGVNLVMAAEAAMERSELPLEQLVDHVLETGRASLKSLNQAVAEKERAAAVTEPDDFDDNGI
ncbi:MAG: PTS galactosamine/N-acetylgalactosamine transporter subunit IIA [Endozoicomonas sp.]